MTVKLVTKTEKENYVHAWILSMKMKLNVKYAHTNVSIVFPILLVLIVLMKIESPTNVIVRTVSMMTELQNVKLVLKDVLLVIMPILVLIVLDL
jgi:hypothetical protein